MTAGAARTAANVVLASAGVAAAVAIVATPPLRRLAALTIRHWLGASVPVLVAETRRAWADSAS
jgi:hypothetical protein